MSVVKWEEVDGFEGGVDDGLEEMGICISSRTCLYVSAGRQLSGW
jgi:hypothetical protein